MDGKERTSVDEPVPPRRFWFRPDGGKVVAEGTLWTDGAVSVHAPGPLHATVNYDALIDLLADHRIADPANAIQWVDEPPVMSGVEWVEVALTDHGVAECAGVGGE